MTAMRLPFVVAEATTLDIATPQVVQSRHGGRGVLPRVRDRLRLVCEGLWPAGQAARRGLRGPSRFTPAATVSLVDQRRPRCTSPAPRSCRPIGQGQLGPDGVEAKEQQHSTWRLRRPSALGRPAGSRPCSQLVRNEPVECGSTSGRVRASSAATCSTASASQLRMRRRRRPVTVRPCGLRAGPVATSGQRPSDAHRSRRASTRFTLLSSIERDALGRRTSSPRSTSSACTWSVWC
jgi:hypothetical protein